jgi:hypothetical protein
MRHHSCPALLALAMAISSTNAFAAERVAVLEFTADERAVRDSLLRQISDESRRAAVDVLPTSRYSVITRENQETILREQGVDAAAMCDAQCEVDLARTIGASLLVTGNVSKIGARFILNVKVFHADRGQVLKIVKVQAADEGALYDQTYAATRRMFIEGLGIPDPNAGVPITAPPTTFDTSPSTSQARISLDSSPRGARVFVDGVKVCESTPCSADVPRRQVTVRMEAIDHAPADDRVKALDGLHVALTLKPTFALVRVSVDPPGLPILVDGRPLAVPDSGLKLDAGTYTFTTGDTCHLSTSEKVSVERGKSYDVNLRASRITTRLLVDASIDGNEPLTIPYSVDGTAFGQTGQAVDVWICASQVRAMGPENLERTAALSLAPQTTNTVRLSFSRAEIDAVAAQRKLSIEQERLRTLENESQRALAAEQAKEAQRIQSFNETGIFFWNVGALTVMILGGSALGIAGIAATPLGAEFGVPQFLPPPGYFIGVTGDDDFFGIMLNYVTPILLGTFGLTMATLGVVWLFSGDLSSTPVWPTDICYGPCACATQPLVPDACLGVE